MSNPSWLTESNVKTAAVVASNPHVQAYAASEAEKQWASQETGQAGTSTNEVNVEALGDQLVAMDRESYSQMKKYGTYLAAAYIITSAMMATSAALVISSADTPTAFVCIYVFMFAVILFCFDCSGCFGLASVSKEMANNCGFMYTGFGRGTFLIFVAVLCFQLKLLGQITMGLLIASTVFHWYVVYKFPQFSAYLRRSHLTNK